MAINTTWGDRTKPSTPWGDRTKPSTSWSDRTGFEAFVILLENGDNLLQENSGRIVLEGTGATDWTNR